MPDEVGLGVVQVSLRWDRQFAENIAAKAENPFWRPSKIQLAVLRRMVREAMGEINQDAPER
ncbi:MAG: hypothetical protein QNJ03_02820 [Dinoroseobacter sp.]|nr:hypothetical protein [Dinoroseobacter sp.]